MQLTQPNHKQAQHHRSRTTATKHPSSVLGCQTKHQVTSKPWVTIIELLERGDGSGQITK
jgi:hypothetical protein